MKPTDVAEMVRDAEAALDACLTPNALTYVASDAMVMAVVTAAAGVLRVARAVLDAGMIEGQEGALRDLVAPQFDHLQRVLQTIETSAKGVSA